MASGFLCAFSVASRHLGPTSDSISHFMLKISWEQADIMRREAFEIPAGGSMEFEMELVLVCRGVTESKMS